MLNFEADEPQVQWVDQFQLSGRESFLTLDIYEHAFVSNPSFTETDLQQLFGPMHQRASLQPNGFIFHMSRCGSTLMANMLRQSDRNLVRSEPEILSQILNMAAPDNREYARDLFMAAVQALGKPNSPKQQNYVVKFSSACTIFMEYIFDAFPDTPKIFLYRDPVEVLASNLKDLDQGWMLSEKVLGIPIEDITQKNTLLENFAIGIQRTCEGFVNHFDDTCMAFNYSQLSEEMFDRLLAFFNIHPGPQDRAAMLAEMGVYSKNRGVAFASDVQKKQRSASPAVRAAADKYLAEVYEKLEALKVDLAAVCVS